MHPRTASLTLAGLTALGLALTPAAAQAGGSTPLTTELVAQGFSRPVFLTSPPGDLERLFVVEQHTGRIEIIDRHTGAVLPTAFLDLAGLATGNEQGLLGLAFHPDYWSNGYFYVNWTQSGGSGTTRIERYQVSANPDVANPASVQLVWSFVQPFTNHNGGWIGFGPDDYLYVSTGDGGSANDPGNRAQDITNQPLGKMLRLDVNGDDFPGDPNRNYAIPPTNPFVGVSGDDEIWHYGLRNPWRASFDRETGHQYIGDVGQGSREEIDVAPAGMGGLNFGWRCMEGFNCTGLSGCTCNAPALELPVHDYTHGGGNCSVTGGYVYRGCAIPDLQGTYFFADYCSSQIWSFEYSGGGIGAVTNRTSELDPPGGDTISLITSFGEDALGEVYIIEQGGQIWRIVPNVAPIGHGSCFGNGCPCGNDDPSAGCANSTGEGGILEVCGTSSVSSDDMVLAASQLPSGQQGLFYMGDALVSNPLYDGIQCALGQSFRFLGSIQNSGPTGTMLYQGVVAASGGLIVSGTTWHFHGWHRDFPASPCGTGANFTHIQTVSFTP